MLVGPDHEIVFQPQIEDRPQELGGTGQCGSTGGKAGCHQEWDGGADRVHGSVWVGLGSKAVREPGRDWTVPGDEAGGSGNEVAGGVGSRCVFVDDSHEGAGHAGGIGVLDDVSSVDNAGSALFHESLGTFEDFLVGGLATATDEDGDASADLDDLVVVGYVIGGIGLDDVSTEFNGLADEGEDLVEIAIDHVAAGLGIGLEDERFDHEGHGVAIAFGFDAKDVLDALIGDLGFAGDAEQIDDDTGGIEAESLFDGGLDDAAEEGARELGAVDVCNIGAQDEGRLVLPGDRLKIVGLTDGELDGIGSGGDDGADGLVEVFDSGEEAALVEEAVVDGDIKAALGTRIEQAVETVLFHAMQWRDHFVGMVGRREEPNRGRSGWGDGLKG